MKVPLFLLLALCISKAAAFGLYGCYERLWYWQAYQMENEIEQSKRKISPGCARDSLVSSKVGPVKGKRCNLRQFLWYISGDDDEKAIISDKSKLKDADLEKEKTSLDEAADKLHKAGLGGFYNPGHIYQGLHHLSAIDQLFNYVASFMQIKSEITQGKPATELFDKAEIARSRVEFGRKATGIRDVGTAMRKRYDKEVWDKQPKNDNGSVQKLAPLVDEGLVKEYLDIPPGGVGGWITCDMQVATESINAHEIAAGRSEVTPRTIRKDFVTPWSNAEPSHKDNIEALKAAKEKLEGGCSARA